TLYRASLVAIFLIAISNSTGFITHSITYENGNPPTGFLADTDIFYGTVEGQTSYWGWTWAGYNRPGFAISGTAGSVGENPNDNVIFDDSSGFTGLASVSAEKYWLDSQFTEGFSFVERGNPDDAAVGKVSDLQ
ncbi:MAG: hypothetical protein MN733_30790, partial [Nitrososphaera sp.]|nr:hypothetical protein [Nitrososphaera sp.]